MCVFVKQILAILSIRGTIIIVIIVIGSIISSSRSRISSRSRRRSRIRSRIRSIRSMIIISSCGRISRIHIIISSRRSSMLYCYYNKQI